jgi:hypothetical protein
MGWFRKRKRRESIEVDGIGRVEDDDGEWCKRAVELHDGFCADVWLGPTERSPKTVAYRALMKDWPRLRKEIEQEAFELQGNYLEQRLPKDATVTRVWTTMREPVVRCVSAGNYELCVTFTWQAEDDPHTVTFYIENGVARGCSIDG